MAATSLEFPTLQSGAVYQTQTAEASKADLSTATVVGGTAKGVLYKFGAYNKNASTVYLWIWDSLTTNNGNLLAPPLPVGSNSFAVFDDLAGINSFSTGLSIAASSSATSFSQLGSNDCWFHVGYARRG